MFVTLRPLSRWAIPPAVETVLLFGALYLSAAVLGVFVLGAPNASPSAYLAMGEAGVLGFIAWVLRRAATAVAFGCAPNSAFS
ncbi:MAG: hypothetical protein HC882_05020 [Acidobacteria bacterium]|nr:hypothetical protein [Acidobacteriota bacterium]